METGLYGQAERGNYFGQRADENRFADIESEGTHPAFKTEAEFRQEMGKCVVEEILASKKERELYSLLNNVKSDKPVLPEILMRALQMTHDQVTEALTKLANVAEEMRADGFSQTLVYNALTAATPIAYRILWNMKAKAEQGSKPKSKIGRKCSLYQPTLETIAKYAEEPSIAPNAYGR